MVLKVKKIIIKQRYKFQIEIERELKWSLVKKTMPS